MTKKELIEALAPYPDNMDVYISNETVNDEFAFSLVDEVGKRTLTFVDGKLKAPDDVIVLELI